MKNKITLVTLMLSFFFSSSLIADDTVKIGDVEMASDKKFGDLHMEKTKFVKWEVKMLQAEKFAILHKSYPPQR